ncbi:MAG: hypothetical protein K9J30_06425 [Bacteroidales bacterium]|nr:hypothetical protein [Bacteroidales bacterium]
MELRDFLTNNDLRLQKEEIVSIIGPDPDAFNALMEYSLSRQMPVCWRAAWIMDHMAEKHPWLAEPHIDKMWNEIPKEHPDGVTRSILRLLTRYEIPEDMQGLATDLCLNWLEKEAVPVAIKVFSMEVLLNITRIHPELRNEFITLIEDQLPFNSAGYKARADRIIKQMKKAADHSR